MAILSSGNRLARTSSSPTVLRHGAGHPLVVTCQHDRLSDAQRSQFRQYRRHAGAWGIHQSDDAGKAPIRPHQHRRASGRFQPFDLRSYFSAHRLACKQLEIADLNALGAEGGADALTVHRLYVRGLVPAQPTFPGRRDDGLSQRMAAAALQRRCQRKDFVLRCAERHDVRETRLSDGDGARLVECDRSQPAKIFQVGAALDQHARLGGPGHGRQNRGRRADGERARRGRHQHRHRPIEGVGKGKAEQGRHGDQEAGADQHDRHEHALDTVREILGRRFLRLGVGDKPHHARQRTFGGELGDLDQQDPVAIDRSREDQRRRDPCPPAPTRRSLAIDPRPSCPR